jgi:hypothetical protein
MLDGTQPRDAPKHVTGFNEGSEQIRRRTQPAVMVRPNSYLTGTCYGHYLCLRSVEGMKVRASAEYSWSEHNKRKDYSDPCDQ